MRKTDILNFIISYISIVVAFIIVLARTKVFSVEEIGIYSYILSISAIITVIVNFGIPRIILRFYELNKYNNFIKRVFQLQLFTFLLFIIILVLMSRIIEINYIIFIIFMVFNQLIITNLDTISIVVNKSVKSNLYRTIFIQSLNIFSLLLIAFFKGNIYQYLTLFIIANFIIIVFYIVLLKENIFFKVNQKLSSRFYKNYLNYGLYVMLNAAASTMILNIDNIMIKNYLGLESVGIYSISFTIAAVIGMVGSVFARSVPPKIVQCLNDKNYLELETIYKKNTEQQIYIGLILLILVISFSKEILGLMGETYIQGVGVLMIIAIAQMIQIGTGMCGTIIGVSKYYKIEVYINGFLLFLTISLNILLIPLYGIIGGAIASLLSILIINIIKIIVVYKKFNIQPYKYSNIKYIGLGIVLYIILFIMNINLIFTIVDISFLSILIFIIYDIFLYFFNERDLLTLKLIKKITRKRVQK